MLTSCTIEQLAVWGSCLGATPGIHYTILFPHSSIAGVHKSCLASLPPRLCSSARDHSKEINEIRWRQTGLQHRQVKWNISNGFLHKLLNALVVCLTMLAEVEIRVPAGLHTSLLGNIISTSIDSAQTIQGKMQALQSVQENRTQTPNLHFFLPCSVIAVWSQFTIRFCYNVTAEPTASFTSVYVFIKPQLRLTVYGRVYTAC
ncbi:hypothetical protein J6590_055660 [Homalodisca vitripennis]|nr:hypothetical protein J6590_055660 [Homalodisca vitripennis]